ncbi:MAG: hypothetical protein ACR2PO_14650 [Methyloligellaceae bacterium]
MAQANFHKSQRVFVHPVGTWAHIERVVPQWVRGCAEPIKVLYDCGMGREFSEEELAEEAAALHEHGDFAGKISDWRVVRGQNRWKSAEQCGHHPVPGTHPVIVTTEREWGGWRVPGAEYDLDPFRIELQARIISRAPVLMALLQRLVEQADQEPENVSHGVIELAQLAQRVLAELTDGNKAVPEGPSVPVGDDIAPPAEPALSHETAAAGNGAAQPSYDAAFPGNGAAPPANGA